VDSQRKGYQQNSAAVLAPPLWGWWGPGVSKELQVTGKNFCWLYMYKYAVFDIKLTYNHEILIPGVYLHPPKISFGASGGTDLSLWGVACPPP